MPGIAFTIPGAHQVNAREQHAIDVEQRLHAARPFLVEELPLRLRKAEVMMRRDAGAFQCPLSDELLFFGIFQNHPLGLSIQLAAHGFGAFVDEALDLMGRTVEGCRAISPGEGWTGFKPTACSNLSRRNAD